MFTELKDDIRIAFARNSQQAVVTDNTACSAQEAALPETSGSVPASPAETSCQAETVIGAQTHIEGSITVAGGLRVLGTVEGELVIEGPIWVAEHGRVTASLLATQVSVAGTVEGRIHCSGRVELLPTAQVTGEVQAEALVIRDGARFEGNSRMGPGTRCANVQLPEVHVDDLVAPYAEPTPDIPVALALAAS
jgi:cytoskeletal protein CcmA (bactofilin family)